MTGAKDQCDLDAEATLCGLCLKEDCPICFGPETLGEE